MQRLLHMLTKIVILFALIAFVVSCNFLLFLNMGNMEADEIRNAAPITFINVIFMTVLFFVLDEIRRKWTVERHVKRIQDGLKKIVDGDFSVRLPYMVGENSLNEFDVISKGINEMAQELSGVETLRTDFISNVSHELKTPLSVIQNLGTMLQSRDLTETERMEYAKSVTEQTGRLSALITNILKLNRLENQQIYPERQKYNLTEQICECLLAFEQSWEKKELEIETDLEEDIEICEDGELLSLVWNNLFSNAIKFTEPGGRVFVQVKKEDGVVAVVVQDEGCGISPEVGSHIFEKFYQGDTSHATQGNGLGLALVKRVIDIVGGDISVQSTLGKGSTFTVKLKEITD
ncbi:MAG: HAMP domain-containing histidine kinase, partial [Eubacterium sp.]|nr:HAMP domain-containing histidine kinase [Eubacterium sp.]